MRLRNIPGARDVIAGHEAVIKEEKQWKGRWDQVFDADGAAESRYQLYWDRALFQCSSTCTGADERIGGGAVQSPVCVYGRVRDR